MQAMTVLPGTSPTAPPFLTRGQPCTSAAQRTAPRQALSSQARSMSQAQRPSPGATCTAHSGSSTPALQAERPQVTSIVPKSTTMPRLSNPARHERSVACKSWWQRLTGGGAGGGTEVGGLVEKPLFSKREMVKLGPLDVSPMGLGTWSWGNQFLWGYKESMDPELQEMFNLVVSSGINLFDTADSYGTGRLNGRSEQLLGQFIAEYPGSEAVQSRLHVATKFATYPWRLTPGSIVSACKGSLQRLGTDQLAVGQLHWSASNYAPWQESALQNGIADCYQQGLIQAVGVSNYGPKQLRKIHRALEQRDVPLASAQIQYSLLSRGKEQQELRSVCADLGITIIAYSPLALGVLSGKYSMQNLPAGPRGLLFRQLLPQLQPLLDLLQQIAEARKKTQAQVAINYLICQGTIPIPGAKDVAQARENLGALGWRLSSSELAELDSVAGSLKAAMVQNIFQTA